MADELEYLSLMEYTSPSMYLINERDVTDLSVITNWKQTHLHRACISIKSDLCARQSFPCQSHTSPSVPVPPPWRRCRDPGTGLRLRRVHASRRESLCNPALARDRHIGYPKLLDQLC